MNAPYFVRVYIVSGAAIFLRDGKIPVFPGVPMLFPQFSLKKRLREELGIEVGRVESLPLVERTSVGGIDEKDREGWPQGARSVPVYSFLVRLGMGEIPKNLSPVSLTECKLLSEKELKLLTV